MNEDLELDMMNQVDAEEDRLMEEVAADENVATHINNQVALVKEPEEEETNAIVDSFKKLNAYSNDLKVGVYRGSLQAITTATTWLGDIAGATSLKQWSEDGEAFLEAQLATTSDVGDVGETVGRVGTGMFLTRGMGNSFVANTGKGGLIDLFAFSGDEGNVADLLEDFGFKTEMLDYLKTDKDDSETEKRLKNAMTGAGLGASVDGIFSMFSYGKKLFGKQGNLAEFKGTDEELIQEVQRVVKEDAETLANKQQEFISKNKKPEEVLEKTAVNFGDDLVQQADDFVNKVEADIGLDLKQPLNAEKIAEGSEEVLAKATEGVESNVGKKTHAETIKDIDEALEKKIGKESFDLIDDMLKTSKGLENLDVKVGQQRVIVGTLAKALDDSIKIAQKDQTVGNMMIVMQNLKNLNTTATTLKNTQSNIARAMSSMKINTANTEMMNTLKLMDAIDPENTMLRLESALGKGDEQALKDFMDNLNDTSKTLKDKVENMQDSKYKKITNALSESVVAGMLSAPSTLAVNVIGNTLVKHQRFLQDTAQFVWGQALRSTDRMSAQTYKHLMSANVGQNFVDMKLVSKNMAKWFKSGAKDEVFDDAILIKFKQDQDFAHKYVDSKYLRGEEKGSGGFFNGAINVTGKIARSPYNMIGYVDDYYKRGAFRAELTRIGGQLADIKDLKNVEFDSFMQKFIQANTELRMIINQGKVPKDEWLLKNKDYIGTGDGITKYTDMATDNANYMTFQKDLGEGLVGKGVSLLNSDGILRILVPFKMTPINILKHSVSTATDGIRNTLNGQILKGGIEGDIARAKITMSIGILTSLGALASSGRITGTFSPEERATMQSAGIPELSVKIGDKWFEYKQVEPYATIAGVMADMNKLYTNLTYRFEDAEVREEVEQEYVAVMSDLALALVQNIANKTYAKSLFEVMSVANGEKDLVDYGGNLLSSVTPLSSLTNYVGRVTNEGFKKEAKGFTERLTSKFRWTLDRDALDLYGRPIKEVDYFAYSTVKQYDADDKAHVGAREIARLGIIMRQMPKSVSFKGFNTPLDNKQHWKLRRSLDKDFNLSNFLNNKVQSQGYFQANDFKRKAMLESIVSKIKSKAMKKILLDKELQKGIKADAQVTINAVNRPKGKRSTWNDLVIGKVGE